MRKFLILCFTLLLTSTLIFAQDTSGTVTVPDVTGLTVPQAAAILNEAGLRFGTQLNSEWSESFATPPNTIGLQSVAAGESVAYGTAIDVTILREANVTLIYDDNDITLVNNAGTRVDLSELQFVTLVSTNEAKFRGRRWANTLRANYCVQLWSVSRNAPKDLPECQSIQQWQTTNNPGDHFWTATNGVQTFAVNVDDEEFAICDAAPRNSQDNPSRCTFFLPTQGNNDVAKFIQMAYTPDIFVLMNPTEDMWMRGNRTTVYNGNPDTTTFGDTFTLADPVWFGDPEILGNVRRLAPGQCIVWVSDAAPETRPPQECTELARSVVPQNTRFWTYDFDVEGLDATRRTCNAAQIDKLTLCLMPR